MAAFFSWFWSFICLFEKVRGERPREILHQLVHSSDKHNGRGFPAQSQELGAASVSTQWVVGVKPLGCIICCCLQVFSRKLGQTWSTWKPVVSVFSLCLPLAERTHDLFMASFMMAPISLTKASQSPVGPASIHHHMGILPLWVWGRYKHSSHNSCSFTESKSFPSPSASCTVFLQVLPSTALRSNLI